LFAGKEHESIGVSQSVGDTTAERVTRRQLSSIAGRRDREPQGLHARHGVAQAEQSRVVARDWRAVDDLLDGVASRGVDRLEDDLGVARYERTVRPVLVDDVEIGQGGYRMGSPKRANVTFGAMACRRSSFDSADTIESVRQGRRSTASRR